MVRRAFLSLGSNLGAREHHIDEMRRLLSAVLIAPIQDSGMMETEPVGVKSKQEPYLNMIVTGGYRGTPAELLDACRSIEDRLGRTERGTKQPRTADVDILLLGDLRVEESSLVVPHPELTHRRFCLEGLVRIDPLVRIPGTDANVTQVLESSPESVRRQDVKFVMQVSHDG